MINNIPENSFTLCKAGPPMKRYETPAITLKSSDPKLTSEECDTLIREFEEAIRADKERLRKTKASSQSISLSTVYGSSINSKCDSPRSGSSSSMLGASIKREYAPALTLDTCYSGCSDLGSPAVDTKISDPLSPPPLKCPRTISISLSQSCPGISFSQIGSGLGSPLALSGTLPDIQNTSNESILISSGYSNAPQNLGTRDITSPKSEQMEIVIVEEKAKPLSIGKRWEEAVKDMIILGMKGDAFRDKKNRASEKILEITNEFRETAVTYMRTIISEKLRPEENRTITTKEVKGFAGGQKFIVGNEYFFKLPDKNIDGKLQYPSYDASAKVAGHEIKACTHFFNEITNPGIYKKIKGLVPKDPNTATDAELSALRNSIIVPPLMVLIDYLGFRAIAMCTFNLDNANTLIGGSADGGSSMINKLDPNTKQLLDLISGKLNLKKHILGNSLEWGFPFDFEVHKSGESYYGIDMSRMFPSTVKGERGKYEYLYKLFRPELVKANNIPINPDWTRDKMNSEEDVANAGDLLGKLEGPGDDILPYKFADSLVKLSPIKEYTDDLTYRMHTMGINTRYLGLVRERLADRYPESDWLCRVDAEIIARSFRKIIVETQHTNFLEGIACNSSTLITDNLNKLFGILEDSGSKEKKEEEEDDRDLWEEINNDIHNRFVFKSGTAYTFSIEDLKRKPFGRSTFMARITDFLGLVWYNDVWTAFTKVDGEESFFDSKSPIMACFLKEIQPRVKQLNIAYHSNGVVVESNLKGNSKGVPPCIHSTIVQSFKSGLERVPSSSVTLRRYAKAFNNYVECLDSLSCKPDSLEDLKRKVDDIYGVLENNETDPLNSYFAAVYFDAKGDIERARKLYIKSNVSKKGNGFLMLGDTYGFTDGEFHNPAEAEKTYREGLGQEKYAKLYNNLGVLLYKKGEIREAGENLLEAFKMLEKKELEEVGHNCVAYCRYVLGREELADKMVVLIEKHKEMYKRK